MLGERTLQGLEVRLKPQGRGRFIAAAFLAFWLCGWAVGETVVFWLLLKGAYALLTGTPPEPGREPLALGPAVATGAFLLVWLAFWTLGGVMAMLELLRLLWGEDRIIAGPGGLTLARMRGVRRRGASLGRASRNGVLNPAFHRLRADDFEVIQLGWNPAIVGVP